MPGTDRPKVERHGEDFAVDAAIIGRLLRLDAEEVQLLMREGQLTSICEKGEGSDAGRFRLSFFYGNRTGRLIVSEDGEVLRRSSILSRGDSVASS